MRRLADDAGVMVIRWFYSHICAFSSLAYGTGDVDLVEITVAVIEIGRDSGALPFLTLPHYAAQELFAPLHLRELQK